MQEDIKLKISADTSQAKKDIEKLNDEEIKINAELKKPKKDFFKELEQEANTLGKKVSDIKLKKENFSKKQITELKKEIENTALKAKAIYFAEGNKSAEELSNRLKEMHKSLAKTKKEIQETQSIFSKMDLIVGNIASSLIQTIGGTLKDLINHGAELNKQLEYADKKIQTISNLSSVDINANIEKIGFETGTDFLQLKEGLYEIISAVGDVDGVFDLLETSNKLAITGFTDLGNAVDGLTTVLNAYKMGMEEADRVANVFVRTQKYGKLTVDDFARDLAQSVPYATQLGVTIEEIGTSIALLTSRGVKPAQAETQLASFLRNLLDDTNELTKELSKNLGTTIKDYIKNGGDLIKLIGEIEKLEKLSGKAITSFSLDSEAKAFILQLKDGQEAYKRFFSGISSTNNEIELNMNKMLNTQKSAVERSQRYWDKFALAIGNIKTSLIANIGDIITGYDKTSAKLKELNYNISNNLEILSELGQKNSLTEEEQNKLNTALDNLRIMAPDISQAFENWKNGLISYTEYVKIATAENERLAKSNLALDYREAKKEESKAQEEYNKLSKIKENFLFTSGVKTEQELTELLRNKANSGNKYDVDNFLKWIDIQRRYDLALENFNKAKDVSNFFDNQIKNYGKQDNKSNESKDNTSGNKKSGDTQPKKQNLSEEDLKVQYDRAYKKEELRIETEYNNSKIKAIQEYNKQMAELKGKGTEQEIEAVKQAYENKLREISDKRDKAVIDNKLKNTYYSDNDKDLKDADKNFFDSQKNLIDENSALAVAEQERKRVEEERAEAEKELKTSIDNMSSNLRNLANLFQTIGDNTNSTSVKNIANGLNIGSTIFDFLKGSNEGQDFLKGILGINNINLDKISSSLGDFSMGAGIGSAISSVFGGGAEGNIGGTIGSAIGTAVGGPVGSVVGGALGSAVGSVFGSKSKKKKKREEEKRKAALERLKKGQISGQFKWQDVVEEFNEDLERAGMGEYISLFDKVSANTNYDNILSTLNSAKRGDDGVSMTVLKQLMPQYTESEIMDWFKAITGGAVLNGDTLSTGEGKYGAIDLSALAQQITNTNRELEKSLKETIKNVIDFTADELAGIVKEGFFDGIDDIGDNIEQMIANSIKNAFINTELAKGLFNGLSDKVQEYITELFKSDGNLGIDIGTDNLEDLTFQQYIDLIKKYMELSSDKMEEIFGELGLNIDNLTDSVDKLNENMSKNVVSGIATNLWKQNLGIKEPVKVDTNLTIDMPVMLSGKEMDRYIIKVVNDSIKRSRRSGNGIGRG